MSKRPDVRATKHLSEAKNAAGWRAAAASAKADHGLAREWVAIAAECDHLLRQAHELLTR